MRAKRSSELLEWVEARAHGHGRPAIEEAARPELREVGPEVIELLFEEVGADGTKVDGEEFAKTSALTSFEVLSLLEQEPSSLGEDRFLARGSQGANFVAADLVDRLAEELHDVKAIEDVNGRGATLADDAEESSPHVARDEGDGLRSLLTEHVEEAVEACGGSMLRDVKQAAASVIKLVDEGEVLVALLPRELIDADGVDAIEVAVFEAPTNSMVDATEDGVPARSEAASDLAPQPGRAST